MIGAGVANGGRPLMSGLAMRPAVAALCLAAGLSGLATPASAKVEYQAYDGPNVVREGRGGIRTTREGVDFWTSGLPPRRFRIVGIVSDDRADKPLSGSAIGSKRIARRVLAEGGSAVVPYVRDLARAGSADFIAGNGPEGIDMGDAFNRPEQRAATRFIVIRYLDK